MVWKARFQENRFLDPGGAGPVPVTQKCLGAEPLQWSDRMPNTRFDGVSSPWGLIGGVVQGQIQVIPWGSPLYAMHWAPEALEAAVLTESL